MYVHRMQLLCVGRHALLADHIASVFRDAGAETRPVVGLDEAAAAVVARPPDAVLCEYDLLATNPLGSWERDPVLGDVPVIAVSLTRRPEEACAFDVNGIAGFLYLPSLDREDAMRTLAGLARRVTGELPIHQAAYALPVHDGRETAHPAG